MSWNVFDLRGLELGSLIVEGHWDYRASRVLHVACQWELFTRLNGKDASAEEIAALLGTDSTMTEKLLIALCAMGLLEKGGGRYRNTLLAETYLVAGKPLYQGDIVRHSASVWNVWHRLEAFITTGRRDAQLSELPDRPAGQEHRDFILGMHNISITGPAQMAAQAVDLSEAGRLLDVGSGPGTYSIAFCQRYPTLRATLFDLPETLAYAEHVVAQFGLSDRIRMQPGNWNDDEFGEGYGALLMSNVLHGPTSNAPMKLGKVYRALRPGGMFLAHDFLLNDEKTGPLHAALFNIMVGTYAVSELQAEIECVGFVDVKIAAVGDRGNALMTARKPVSSY